MSSEILPNKLSSNSGVDIGDVTVNNASGASAVNIQDGGNSITVDGSDFDIRNLSALTDTVGINVQKDLFGHVKVVQPYNQVEMRLDDASWTSFVNQATASGGTIAQASGLVSLTTGTNTAGSAIISSNDPIEYRPGVGIFGAGTAVFTTGDSGCTQRVGLSDDTSFNNSVTFGYEGTSFGIRYTRNGSQVSFTAQSSWDDPCDGVASGSLFTRNGVKEALDPTKGNLYRVLAGLFGFAGFVCQVFSPDNGWITVFTYRHANAETVPVFTSNTLKVVLAATKTSGASSFVLKSQCWAGGTGSALERVASTLTDRRLAQTVRSVLAAKMPGGSYTNIGATAGGNLKVSIEEIDGAATMPVSGTVTANAGTGTFAVSAASLPLPTGASTAAKQPALGTAGTASADVITVQGIASMTALNVDGSAVTQPVSGTVTANAGTGTFAISAASLPLPSGAATAAKQPALGTAGTASSDVITVQGIASMTAIKVDGSAVTQPVSGSVTANPTRPATSTLSNVATSTASAQLIASNASRLGATIWNDSTASLYVKFGTTASATSCTVKIAADGYYEVPFDYTGRIDGILATGTGNARVTELTA